MLEDDIKLVAQEMESSTMWSHKRESWYRIKKALESVKQSAPPTNSPHGEITPCLNSECTYNSVDDSEGGNCAYYHFDNLCECNDYMA